MNCDSLSAQNLSAECFVYTPGLWEQDLYTLPLEGLIVTAVSNRTPPEKPRWPFNNEVANGVRNPTRQPGLFATSLGAAVGIPLFIDALNSNHNFPLNTYLRGLVHAHLWNEFFTSSAKGWFGRKRPFYDTVERRGEARQDDRYSFFSGHASHAFTFATYATHLAFAELREPRSAWVYATLLNATATWVASSRAIDKQHNWSDVLVGSLVGVGVGYATFDRVQTVSKFPVSVALGARSITISVPTP
ncbi:phosphatase PAP2 family protein [bacterium]|nr:phosphatase PAP2 family protein [bacterium]